MKIRVNYELMNKIQESKKGLKLQKVLVPMAVLGMGSVIIRGMIMSPVSNTSPVNIALPAYVLSMATTLPAATFAIKLFKNYFMENAEISLQDLVNELYSIDVKTNRELLKESKVIGTNYKFRFIDSKPILKKERYIEVPLINGYTETLLEEHNVGSNKYDLSIGEPTKKLKLKPAKSI